MNLNKSMPTTSFLQNCKLRDFPGYYYTHKKALSALFKLNKTQMYSSVLVCELHSSDLIIHRLF